VGNYSIHIEGVGCHGNRGADFDAETAAQRLVRDLVLHGHDVRHATVHAGGGATTLEYLGPKNVKAVARSDGYPDLPVMSAEERAAHFYAVYCESSGGKNFRGDPCPAWAELPEAIRWHWTAVAKAAAR
jgi:hypothetical protein